MRLQVGEEIGSYRVIGVVGSGASGTVFQVEHLFTKRVEAMKVLAEELTADPEQVRRFLRESQVQAQLSHPHLVSVHNAFFENRKLCLVMQWVDGEPLNRRIAEGTVPRLLAVNIARQLLSALSHAHEHGVIHRDVKPANILIDREGHVKLTDFGLARPCADKDTTQPGIALGSVHYMSPEQIRGLPNVDARSDLYSVGAVLYEMLTGRKLFDGPDAFSVMKAQVEQTPVPPAAFVPGLPSRLNDVILRALNKDPALRFQNAWVFLDELEAVCASPASAGPKVESAPAAAAPRSRVREALVTALVLTAALGTAGFGYARYRSAALDLATLPPPPPSALLAPPAPPAQALILSSPPVEKEEPKPVIPAPAPAPAQPKRPRAILPPEPPQIRAAAPIRIPAEPAAAPYEAPPPPSAAPAGEAQSPTSVVDTVVVPPEEIKKTTTVKRFFGKINPLRVLRKGPEKPAQEQRNEPD